MYCVRNKFGNYEWMWITHFNLDDHGVSFWNDWPVEGRAEHSRNPVPPSTGTRPVADDGALSRQLDEACPAWCVRTVCRSWRCHEADLFPDERPDILPLLCPPLLADSETTWHVSGSFRQPGEWHNADAPWRRRSAEAAALTGSISPFCLLCSISRRERPRTPNVRRPVRSSSTWLHRPWPSKCRSRLRTWHAIASRVTNVQLFFLPPGISGSMSVAERIDLWVDVLKLQFSCQQQTMQIVRTATYGI